MRLLFKNILQERCKKDGDDAWAVMKGDTKVATTSSKSSCQSLSKSVNAKKKKKKAHKKKLKESLDEAGGRAMKRYYLHMIPKSKEHRDNPWAHLFLGTGDNYKVTSNAEGGIPIALNALDAEQMFRAQTPFAFVSTKLDDMQGMALVGEHEFGRAKNGEVPDFSIVVQPNDFIKQNRKYPVHI